jgi:hypothetical protein
MQVRQVSGLPQVLQLVPQGRHTDFRLKLPSGQWLTQMVAL